MTLLTVFVPLLVACGAVAAVYWLRRRFTRRMSWPALVTWPLPALVFVPALLATSALVVRLVAGDIEATYLFDGSRGPALWQLNTVTILSGDDGPDIVRQRLDIIDIDRGGRIARLDYSNWAALPIEVEVLGEGRDFVWLYSEKLGLHTRDIYTGKWLRGQAELIANVALAARPFKHDASTRGLVVATKDGRTLYLDARTLKLGSTSGEHAPNRYVAQLDRDVPSTAAAQFDDGWLLHSRGVDAAVPDARFVLHLHGLTRLDRDGRMRWTSTRLTSNHLGIDHLFTSSGKLCVLAGARLTCLGLDTGN